MVSEKMLRMHYTFQQVQTSKHMFLYCQQQAGRSFHHSPFQNLSCMKLFMTIIISSATLHDWTGAGFDSLSDVATENPMKKCRQYFKWSPWPKETIPDSKNFRANFVANLPNAGSAMFETVLEITYDSYEADTENLKEIKGCSHNCDWKLKCARSRYPDASFFPEKLKEHITSQILMSGPKKEAQE